VQRSELAIKSNYIYKNITSAITKADIIIAVIDSQINANDSQIWNANVFFEIGYAFALHKEILVLTTSDIDLPFDIKGILTIRARPDNRDAIDFALNQLLSNLESKQITEDQKELLSPDRQRIRRFQISSSYLPSPKSTRQEKKLKYHALGSKVDKYIVRLNELGNRVTELEINDIIVSAFKESGISIIAQSAGINERGADLAIWVDELGSLSNPILIEIRKFITNSRQAEDISKQMAETLKYNKSRFALVLYSEGISEKQYIHPLMESFIYFINVIDFIESLRLNSFIEIIRELQKSRYELDK